MYVLDDMRVVQKEEKRVNMVDRWCIVLCHGDLKGMEIYSIGLWSKIIAEGSDTTYFSIKNPSIFKNQQNRISAGRGRGDAPYYSVNPLYS